MSLWWNPNDYSITEQLRLKNAFSALNRLNFKYQAGEKILDVGCGNGTISAALAKTVPHSVITGIDLSLEMINYAKQHHQVPNLKFIQQDIIDDSQRVHYDKVVSFACLHWIKNQAAALKAIADRLNPNGEVFIMLYPRKGPTFTVLDEMTHSAKWRKYFIDFQDPFYFFDILNYPQLVAQANLTLLDVEERYYFGYDNKESFDKITRGWLPQLKQIPSQQQDEFMSDFIDRLMQLKIAISNRFPLPLYELIVSAKKTE